MFGVESKHGVRTRRVWACAMTEGGRAPRPSDAATAKRMQLQRQRNTGCELAVRRLLHAKGLRYRIDCRAEKGVPRRADIVVRPAKVAVFVDGCFWHGCPEHWKAPSRHETWWTNKVSANAKRDRETTLLLERAGWLVIRAWEHEEPEAVADRVLEAVRERHPRGARLRIAGGPRSSGKAR